MTLEKFRELVKEGTPAPWKYDWGNWEVEGPRPDRYPIAAMSLNDRKPGFHGQQSNPVESGADGELIAALRNHADLFLELWSEGEKMRAYQKTRHDRHLGCHSVDGHGMRGYCDCWEPAKQAAETRFDAVLAKLQGEKGDGHE